MSLLQVSTTTRKKTTAHALLRWNTREGLGDLSVRCRWLAVVSVKLMQQQKKVVHHRRPQPYVVKSQSSSFQMRLRTGRSHEKHAERMNGTGESTFEGSSCERPNGRSKQREQNGVVFEVERPDCSVPAQQQQQQHHDDDGGGGGGDDDDAPRRIKRNASGQ